MTTDTLSTITIGDQLDLDLSISDSDMFTWTSGNDPITITAPSSGKSILDGLTTDSFSLSSTWDTSYHAPDKRLDKLFEWQEEVNKKLAILQPNPELEEQWSELKELRQRYIELEKELTEKTKMWDILKD
jgi:cell shape-determining protein MreC